MSRYGINALREVSPVPPRASLRESNHVPAAAACSCSVNADADALPCQCGGINIECTSCEPEQAWYPRTINRRRLATNERDPVDTAGFCLMGRNADVANDPSTVSLEQSFDENARAFISRPAHSRKRDSLGEPVRSLMKFHSPCSPLSTPNRSPLALCRASHSMLPVSPRAPLPALPAPPKGAAQVSVVLSRDASAGVNCAAQAARCCCTDEACGNTCQRNIYEEIRPIPSLSNIYEEIPPLGSSMAESRHRIRIQVPYEAEDHTGTNRCHGRPLPLSATKPTNERSHAGGVAFPGKSPIMPVSSHAPAPSVRVTRRSLPDVVCSMSKTPVMPRGMSDRAMSGNGSVSEAASSVGKHQYSYL